MKPAKKRTADRVPPLTTTRAPSSRALSSTLVSSGVGWMRTAAKNMARPAMAASQLFQMANGRMTRAAPAKPRRMRKASQERGSWRNCEKLGDEKNDREGEAGGGVTQARGYGVGVGDWTCAFHCRTCPEA